MLPRCCYACAIIRLFHVVVTTLALSTARELSIANLNVLYFYNIAIHESTMSRKDPYHFLAGLGWSTAQTSR